MKDRPILFSGSMVQAILAGHKTQTRRVVKLEGLEQADVYETRDGDLIDPVKLCPYGVPGDRLWVKEAIGRGSNRERKDWIVYAVDGAWHPDANWAWKRGYLPSMFMPRGLSRITLEVTAVRVERVQEISEADAKSEGVVPLGAPGGGWGEFPHREAYRQLWDDLNMARGFGWSVNPWVWVITFRRIP